MRRVRLLVAFSLLAASAAVGAQLMPGLPRTGDLLGVARPLADDLRQLPAAATRLARERLDRLVALARSHPREIAIDPDGNAARAGELLLGDSDDALLARAAAQGFRLIERKELIGVTYARLATPPGMSLARATRALRRLGATDVSSDPLYEPSGRAPGPAAAPMLAARAANVGVIDGGIADAAAAQRGFAAGSPRPSDHASAIASLVAGGRAVRGAAPEARLHVADVYGTDPAGGGAGAIAQALAWMVAEKVPVVTVSLVGPANPLLGRVVAAAQAHGTVIVAPVGNDGPAAPLAYPASYPGVIAITGVDAKRRVLIEAGRASHLDYAAPAADMLAADRTGRPVRVRGTSYAAPLVAGLIAQLYPAPDASARPRVLATLDRRAQRLGPRYGRGLLCEECVTRP